ncbi:hypothetical protein [Gilliamella apicola]|uniref:hypothetical protein n=1 Tax=Gilliamella apicola TaxID=1196095 RepID=UPI000D78C688|nr:hypothetical protein [Gilliamella apicola]PXY99965.1 hypothetical protein DKK69_07135 [Gilliamella apicola]WLS90446.1 hypothetical protein RAM21_07085 [Gilliamella apicola]
MLKYNWFVEGHNLDSSLKLKKKVDFLTSISSNSQKYLHSTSNFALSLTKIMLGKSFYCKILLISASIFVGLSINDVTALNVRTANVIQANPTYLINTEEADKTQSGLALSDNKTLNENSDDELNSEDQIEDESELNEDQMIEANPVSGNSHLIKSIN